MDALPPTITDSTVTLTYAAVQSGVSSGEYFGYCTIADVKYEFPELVMYPDLTDPTSAPAMNGNTRIAMEITYAAQELQAELAHFYTMPYSGSSGNILLQLRELNAKLATARIIERYFRGASPNASQTAAEIQAYVAEFYTSIADGKVRWDAPFGDATVRAMLPVYDLSSGNSITPNPGAFDGSQTPLFSVVGIPRYNGGGVL